MENIEKIQQNEVYQQILKDSYGGILYNVANRDKYDVAELIKIWDSMTPSEQGASGGIMKGAMNFVKGN